jgi:hypothetical protein
MRRLGILIGVTLLAACSSTPPPPDWQMSAKSSLDNATIAWFEGRDAVERAEFARARAAVARTGRPELVARTEAYRCALRVATLHSEPCTGFDTVSADALPEDAAYARYLSNRLKPGDAERLPPAHRAALGAADPAGALQGVADPVTRLVAAGAALRRGQASPGVVQLAVDTASAQGWPRPLLAWLGVQQQAALSSAAALQFTRPMR